MHKITFVAKDIIQDMYNDLYDWNAENIDKYDIKHLAVSSVAANPNTTLITYTEEVDETTGMINYIPTENDTTENVQKKYKNCINVFYDDK